MLCPCLSCICSFGNLMWRDRESGTLRWPAMKMFWSVICWQLMIKSQTVVSCTAWMLAKSAFPLSQTPGLPFYSNHFSLLSVPKNIPDSLNYQRALLGGSNDKSSLSAFTAGSKAATLRLFWTQDQSRAVCMGWYFAFVWHGLLINKTRGALA